MIAKQMFHQLYESLTDCNKAPTTLLCIIIILLFIKCKRQQESKSASMAKHLLQNNVKLMPTPPSIPIIGHIHLLRDYKENPWDGFQEIRKQFGNVVSLKMGIHQMVLVSSIDAMMEILLDKGDIFSNRPNFPRHHIMFGGDKENSLALCNWSGTHRDRRKMCKRGIAPNKFSSRNQLLESIVCRMVLEFVDMIKDRKPGYLSVVSPGVNEDLTEFRYFSVTKHDILLLTSDLFMDFLCSESMSHIDPAYRDFAIGCDFVFWDINQIYLIDFLPFLTTLGLGSSYLKKLKRVTDFLRGYIDDKLFDPRYEKIKKLELKKVNQGFEDFEELSEDYLDSLILEYMSQETSMSLADYKVGFADLVAGHAAVANIIMRLLGHLALDREYQDMIYHEAHRADLNNLNYKPSLPITEAALQEALRLASSPIVPHVAHEDTSIDQFHVPKGTMVLFNNYYLNLSENLWNYPYKFNPMRFLEPSPDSQLEFKLNIPKYFMPFSVGLRQCLGYKMVETTTIVFVANLCRNFVIKVDDEDLARRLIAPKGSIALNPDAACFELRLYPR